MLYEKMRGISMDESAVINKEFKVFISYSWTTLEHETWVYDLAIRLMENGIEVKFDKWDLEPGKDKYAFMESMVQDTTIDRVILICDKGYKEKANSKQGGVGTETQIISPEIYEQVNQKKFIPVIAERGDTLDAYLPTYLKSRIAIDMSSEDVYETGYEKLLRSIAERPEFRKPEKGQLPAFLFEDEKGHMKTNNIIKQLKHSLINKPEKAKYNILEFIEEFKNTLEVFKIETLVEPHDEQIYNNINDMLVLRNDYIEFLSLMCKSNLSFDLDIIINLFEEMYNFTEFQGTGSFYNEQCDHYRFFINELFLYTVIIFMDSGMLEEIKILLSTRYFVKVRNKEDGINFSGFRFYIGSINEWRNQRLKLNRISVVADLLIQRSLFNNKSYKSKVTEIDLLLCYISIINANGDYRREDIWFPTTHIFKEYGGIDFLKRLSSKRHFDKVSILFNVKTKEEMQGLLIYLEDLPNYGYSWYNSQIPNIGRFIKNEDICKFA